MKKSISLDKKQDENLLRITAHYVEQVQSGQRPCLSDYLARYPEYTDPIVDFIAYYHAFEEQTTQETRASVVSETLSEVSRLALEYACQHVCSGAIRERSAIHTLFMKKDRHRLSLSSLATELDLSIDVVMQLEQRYIDPASIPLALSRHLCRVLQQPLSAIQDFFAEKKPYTLENKSQPSQQRVAEQQQTYVSPKWEDRPQLPFRQVLIASTQLSERQRAAWFKLLDHENMSGTPSLQG